ncbi:hypothetical protein [Cryptosporangium arvum]|uniref:Uncharacterized protein n=1 Tax=Cryptosporangium arvum DSM 44712 TaxID=927661 RepID=A0A010Z1W7_9ACTN|nr:hypothetical protein [Cryptosporangium arvum]EXG81423.1 hypothetical protein CryarDRAFT_2537 [Cryptosporangium arvum DSM 44712]
MSAIAAYARALAVVEGVAQPITTVAHVHVAARPLVLVPLALAGEANAPLAALVGTDPASPRLLIVPQPRDRQLRFAFAASLADVVLDYLSGFPVTEGDEPTADDAPQLWVPNRGGFAFLRLFGRSTRFRRTTGPYPVAPGVPVLGRWLTWFAERSEYPGASTLLAATEVLGAHWATGQSALEDANLAALLGWIDPPPGRSAREAARDAEDALRWPPAGPSTDPTFDNEVLSPAISAYGSSPDGSALRRRALAGLESALRGQTQPTWELVWRAIDRMRTLTPGGSVAGRWAADARQYASFHRWMAEDGLPQARRDGAVAAARRLLRLEWAHQEYAVSRSFDDPRVMADFRVTGEAFRGTVTEVDAERRVENENGNLVKRPLVVVRTEDPVHLAVGTAVGSPARPKQSGRVLEIDDGLVTVEIAKGLREALPRVGDDLTYSSVLSSGGRGPNLPPVEDTPWTHGGPPEPYVPTDEDAVETWE